MPVSSKKDLRFMSHQGRFSFGHQIMSTLQGLKSVVVADLLLLIHLYLVVVNECTDIPVLGIGIYDSCIAIYQCWIEETYTNY